ncbi:DUF664 domain-containing protein [Catenulispora sp. NF23]|uniref:mycothiol transferase n=1 Tax=Catenulispora pinistramenti TaxID=2705254 RepID=UPI001BA4E544|nr:DUF664 domain-containing protein [Catenulispora pinistramenti]MBS2535511.1 DUF664 domain-containing protein [Catenulispora pinistramenti]
MSDLGPPAVVAGEKETLLAFLRYLREAIIRKVAETDTVARCVAAYRAATVRADALWASLDDLDAVSVREDRTLRWILVHTVEELARHAGQLDILRELIDGDVGR